MEFFVSLACSLIGEYLHIRFARYSEWLLPWGLQTNFSLSLDIGRLIYAGQWIYCQVLLVNWAQVHVYCS